MDSIQISIQIKKVYLIAKVVLNTTNPIILDKTTLHLIICTRVVLENYNNNGLQSNRHN